MYIIHYRLTYFIDFCKFRIDSFLQEHEKNSYTLQSEESNYQNYASVQTELSIKLKFDMYIVDPRSSHYVNFDVSRRYSFYRIEKYHAHRPTGSKYLRTF